MSGGWAGCGDSEGPAVGETDSPGREQSAEAAVGQHGSTVSSGAAEGRRGEVRDVHWTGHILLILSSFDLYMSGFKKSSKSNVPHNFYLNAPLLKSPGPPSQEHAGPAEGCLYQAVWRLQRAQRGTEEERGLFI